MSLKIINPLNDNIYQKQVASMPKLTILDLQSEYPFGVSKDICNQNTKVLVKESLQYHNSTEYEKLKRKVFLYKAIKHPNLVNLDHYLEENGIVHIFFEYVPLKLETWICEVNPGILEKIRQEIHCLLKDLFKAQVRIQFNPNCIGLGPEMQAKYFLSSLDLCEDNADNKEHFMAVKASVDYFFDMFMGAKDTEKVDSQESTANLQAMSKPTPLQNSTCSSKNQSYEEDFNQVLYNDSCGQQVEGKKNSQQTLEDKIQAAKMKSQQALKNFKKYTHQ